MIINGYLHGLVFMSYDRAEVFAPLDIHPGDESYYILNGPVVQRSGNGQFAYLETGEGLFMPEGAWHCCHNFSDQKARILYFITPKAWSESIPPAVNSKR